RRKPCGAWTSSSIRPRRPTRRRVRFSKASNSRLRTERANEMAKLSQINRNKKREKLVAQYAIRRAALKATADNMSVAPEDRFAARLKLAELPRNSSKVRVHHR